MAGSRSSRSTRRPPASAASWEAASGGRQGWWSCSSRSRLLEVGCSQRRPRAARSSAQWGHAAAGMSRHDLKELGEHLDTGTAGLVVVAVSDMGAKVEHAMKRAAKLQQKELKAENAEIERDAASAAKAKTRRHARRSGGPRSGSRCATWRCPPPPIAAPPAGSADSSWAHRDGNRP
jgi:hypothetical protein